jgi:hypothetical protein
MANDTAGEQPQQGLPAHLRDDLKWKPGQSGNPAGRPKGARTQLGESFCKAMLDDFEKHGVEAIQLMRDERPGDYAKMIAGMLTKEVGGPDGEDIAVAHVMKIIGVKPSGI